MTYETIQVRAQGPVCFIRFDRPDARNAINTRMLEEICHALDTYEDAASIVVLEGSAEYFCFGADLSDARSLSSQGTPNAPAPDLMYDLWMRLAGSAFITIAHIKGVVNAGGVGFVAASDIVIAQSCASFALSEMLFGLMPACVIPFLARRIGFQRTNFMTLSTQTVSAQQALDWGLVDILDDDSDAALRRNLSRLRRISKRAIASYRQYAKAVDESLPKCKDVAVSTNVAIFSDPKNIAAINHYMETGLLPSIES
ncbi:enoyl-CoA hydratase/isomerase [Trinickia sp. NRRL B-1857]|uniref:enoyl-CoA hydratase/isomerase n=1 Tax=Trinickia sp. NRRL B-1857 TaxID=3162879 RepID=UPI003D2AD69F